MPWRGQFLDRSRVVAVVEVSLLCVAAPVLLLPSLGNGRLPQLAFGMLLVPQGLRFILATHRRLMHPLLPPALILLAMALVGLSASVDPALTWQKIDGLALGIAVYLAASRLGRRQRGLLAETTAIVVATATLAAVGLVSASWTGKLPVIGGVVDRIPHLITAVPTSTGVDAGINPNELGGMLALLWPIVLAQVALARFGQGLWRSQRHVVGLVLVAVFVGLVLLVTLSLSALFGTVLGLLVFGMLLFRRLTVRIATLCAALLAAALGTLFVARPTEMERLVTTYSDHLAQRVELWQRGVLILHDFPITGIGMNTLSLVVGPLYPLILGAGDPLALPHVHNFLLQTGVDLGVPGLLALCWLLGVAGRLLVAAWRSGGSVERHLAAGVAAGLCAHLVFGLTDAVALGARPGFLLWWVLGLCESVYQSAVQQPDLARRTGWSDARVHEQAVGYVQHPV